MQIKNDEKTIKDFLISNSLACEYFSKEEKRNKKTPDFRVLYNKNLEFFCEVKTIMKDTWKSGARNDPIFNRLTDDIHTAIKQFDSINKDIIYPNVLAFVNHDYQCGHDDLISTITGNFSANNGKQYPIYEQFSHGRIRNEKSRIHLFLWFDDNDLPRFFFNKERMDYFKKLCDLFKKSPENMENIKYKK